jgi:hypothetical protein
MLQYLQRLLRMTGIPHPRNERDEREVFGGQPEPTAEGGTKNERGNRAKAR